MEESYKKDLELLQVFDFDGTLVDIDTTERFFIKTAKENYQLWILGLIFILKVGSKFGFFTVKRAKEILLNLLFDSLEDLQAKAEDYGKSVVLNDLGKAISPRDENVIVISATIEPILRSAMPETFIIGSTVSYENNKFSIPIHPFREEKASILKGLVKNKDFVFYTDSNNDFPCAVLAIETKWIKRGKIKLITKQMKC